MIVQQTVGTTEIERIKLETNERNVKKGVREKKFESACEQDNLRLEKISHIM